MNEISIQAPVTVDRAFAEEMLRTIDNPQQHGVHILFNSFWKYVPEAVTQKYLRELAPDEAQQAFMDERHLGAPYSFEALTDLPDGSLGRALHRYIIDNNLKQEIADTYRAYHDSLERAGALDRMPEAMKFSVLRTYQTHDFIHLLTGFATNGLGEIAVQAFCLAQHRSPYFAIWVSVVTARMTYLNPDKIEATMDAVTEGWSLGRRVGNLMVVRWEELLDRSVESLRLEYGIAPEGRAPSTPASAP
ncbi:MAG TPA: Coq4 family protein [Caulobacteraceae bacterium]|jgi:ubiquinone biosynthesis protein Coq4|nr:Coq4 family protein [Caulobacteraceae bacterium]